MKKIYSRAPLRISFAGGGSDVDPFCSQYGGAVLNTTIDQYAYTVIESRGDHSVVFHAQDLKYTEQHSPDTELDPQSGLKLNRAVHTWVQRTYGFSEPMTVTTFCEAPVGSGLGSSSTIVVSILEAYNRYYSLGLKPLDLAGIAYTLERSDCGLAGGRQDQYSAAVGGMNFMEFGPGAATEIETLCITQDFRRRLESSLILYFTGVSRDSDRIIHDQAQHIQQGHQDRIQATRGLAAQARRLKLSMVQGNWRELVESMRLSWENKKRLSSQITNTDIDNIYDSAIQSGALAGKVSGAGGGGFMYFLTPPEHRLSVTQALSALGGQTQTVNFTSVGAHSWAI